MTRLVMNLVELAKLPFNHKIQERCGRGAEEVAGVATRMAPKDTGAGAASIHAEQAERGTWHVSWDAAHDYMRYPEFGTESQAPKAFLRGAAAQFK
jgi:HK97 gp10 family phage protein